MDSNIDFYFDGQDDKAKLIYTVGLLWNQINNRLDNILLKSKLNISKFNILMIIKHIGKDEGIQQNEISKRLLVTASNITKLLDKLESEGMITRNAQKNDRRVKLIKITDSGSNLLDEIYPYYIKEINEITAKLQNHNLKNLDKILLDWLISIK